MKLESNVDGKTYVVSNEIILPFDNRESGSVDHLELSLTLDEDLVKNCKIHDAGNGLLDVAVKFDDERSPRTGLISGSWFVVDGLTILLKIDDKWDLEQLAGRKGKLIWTPRIEVLRNVE